MVVVPGIMPITEPEAEPIVATEVLLLTHVPPVVAISDNVMNEPVQTLPAPEMGLGVISTVTTTVLTTPDTVYEIVTVPGATPETIPELTPTVALDVLPLVHAPPGDASVSVVVDPTHTVVAPVGDP